MITIQPAEQGGTLPYPLHVDEDGTVGRQDFWQGKPARVVGFSPVPRANVMSLDWEEFTRDPSGATGLYVVSEDADGTWYTHWCSPIAKVTVT